MDDYLLDKNDLKSIPKYKRRSPFLNKDPIYVFKIKDIKDVAMKKYGTLDNIGKIKETATDHFQNIYAVMKYFKSNSSDNNQSNLDQTKISKRSLFSKFKESIRKSDGHIVLTAICVNSINTVAKAFAWIWTGSDALFAEFVHSCADTLNQSILLFGALASVKRPNKSHPYGYRNVKHISSLMSGVAIFCLGSGVSFYHGIYSLNHPHPIENIDITMKIILFSFITEFYSFYYAARKINAEAKKHNVSFSQYVFSGKDPSSNVVLFEDSASLIGLIIAATSISLSHLLNNPSFDACGSLAIGSLLGVVAYLIIKENISFLLGKDIGSDLRTRIISDLEGLRVIRSVHDVKAVKTSGDNFRFKAEIDFDGKELVKAYLKTSSAQSLISDLKNIKDPNTVEKHLMLHGEQIIDHLGAEIDKIENFICMRYPKLDHLDLEVL